MPNLAGIATVAPRRFKSSVYRIVPALRKNKLLSTEGNRFFPGRYHIIGETGILYTSLSEQTATLEIERHADRSMIEGGLAIAKIEVVIQKVLDLTDGATLKKLGISKDDLVSSNHSLTQAISIQARKDGFQGLRVPSATGSGENLVIFENNFGMGCSLSVGEIRDL